MLTEKQLEERRGYIGGSDVGPILGYSKWRSALDVYREKVDGDYIDSSGNSFIYWGNKAEPMIREVFEELTGYKVSLPESVKLHKDHAFLGANVDGIVNEGEAILEIKTVSPFARKHWGTPDDGLEEKYGIISNSNGFKNSRGYIPESYLFQCALYSAIYEIDKVYIAVYFGNDMPLRIYQYDRDSELEEILLEKMAAFWHNHILKQIPPDPETLKDLELTYATPIADSTTVADMSLLSKYEELKELREKKQTIEERTEQIKKDICLFMKDSELLLDINGQKMCGWKGVRTARFDAKRFKEENKKLAEKYMKQSSSRRFLIY
jgi:putative phage-type endonuclease